MFFTKNGQRFDTAFTLEENECKDKALFPHIATKNIKMSLNFSSPVWSEVEGVEDYQPLQEATDEHKVRATKVRGGEGKKEGGGDTVNIVLHFVNFCLRPRRKLI